MFNLGILLGYFGGTFINYELVPIVMMSAPILFFVTFIFMPNTPQYLLAHNRIEVGNMIYYLLFYLKKYNVFRMQKNHFDFIEIVKKSIKKWNQYFKWNFKH